MTAAMRWTTEHLNARPDRGSCIGHVHVHARERGRVSIAKVTSAVDSTGKIAFWKHDVYFAGGRGAEFFYDVPHVKSRAFGSCFDGQPHRFGVGAWRGPGANMNIWARESHVDAMAAEAGIDPLEFRLKNLKDARMRGVLQAAAAKFGWTPKKRPAAAARASPAASTRGRTSR